MAATNHGPGTGTSPKLLLVDGHAYAYRAFHAIRHLSSPSGRPTNAIFGFVKMLARMRTTVAPTHWAVVWDGGLSGERVSALPEYKAQRPPMPAALEEQLDELVAWLEASEIASLVADGIEADDWIAALARRAEVTGWSVVIASADKDFMQLVSDRVRLLNPGDKTERFWGPAEVRQKTGVEPSQVVDWLSLVGDSVDNIPGVPGVGVRTAANLLQKFGSISAMIQSVSQVEPERIRQAVAASAAVLQRNQALIRLKIDGEATLGPELRELAVRPGKPERMIQLCAQWGFRSLRQELERSRLEPALIA